jgi:hypothetical protein
MAMPLIVPIRKPVIVSSSELSLWLIYPWGYWRASLTSEPHRLDRAPTVGLRRLDGASVALTLSEKRPVRPMSEHTQRLAAEVGNCLL